MDYDEAVKQGREAAKSQWILGDLALALEPKYGNATLATFADDIGVEYDTLSKYKRVAKAYADVGNVSEFQWSLALVLAAQPDRAELVKTVNTVKEARELVKERNAPQDAAKAAKRKAKEAEAAKTKQPSGVPTVAGSTRLEEAKGQYIEVPKGKEPPSYKDLTGEQKRTRVAMGSLTGSIQEGILALFSALTEMAEDREGLEQAREEIRDMEDRIKTLKDYLEECLTEEMSD